MTLSSSRQRPPPRPSSVAQRLPRASRLRKRRDYLRVQSGPSIRRRAAPFLLLARFRDDEGPARLGVVASKKVGSAVARNRAKRVFREAFRTLEVPPPRGVDLVLVAHAGVGPLHMPTVRAELARVLAGLRRGLAPTGGATQSPGSAGGARRAPRRGPRS